jgi:IS30 family transposase
VFAQKTVVMCVQSLFINIFGKIKKKGEFVFKSTNNWERYRKEEVKDSRGVLSNRRLIENRPKIVDLKQRFGDLEIDTIIGKNHKGAIVTINDRATGILRMKKESELVKQAAIELLENWKPYLFTITSDNGKNLRIKKSLQY